jgi:hypothetical protein
VTVDPQTVLHAMLLVAEHYQTEDLDDDEAEGAQAWLAQQLAGEEER